MRAAFTGLWSGEVSHISAKGEDASLLLACICPLERVHALLFRQNVVYKVRRALWPSLNGSQAVCHLC